MAGLYTHTTRASGTILTATIYNADHQNHIDNQDPEQMDDYSPNATGMRVETDPGENGTESLPTSLAGELERIRYVMRALTGKTYWYEHDYDGSFKFADEGFTLVSDDADGAVGPVFTLHRNSATPVDTDLLGAFNFDGEDDASAQVTYAQITVQADDVSAGSEDSTLLLKTIVAGTLTTQLDLSSAGAAFTATISAPIAKIGTANSALIATSADELIIYGLSSGGAGLTIASDGTTGSGNINFSDDDDSIAGGIQYDHNTDIMKFYGQGDTTELMNFSATGVATFAENIQLGDAKRLILASDGDSWISEVSANTVIHKIGGGTALTLTASSAVFAGSGTFGDNLTLTNGSISTTEVSDVNPFTISSTHATFTKDVGKLNSVRNAGTTYDFLNCTADSDNNGSGVNNMFKLRADGTGFADVAWSTPAADYAEFFAWEDENPDEEDRVGYSVVLENDKIRVAKKGETPIGIISGAPSFIGNNPLSTWKDQFLKDDFNRNLTEEYEALEWEEEDEDGKIKQRSFNKDNVPDDVTVPDDAVTVTEDSNGQKLRRKIINPEYDHTRKYSAREFRKEWDTVGLMGILPLRKGQPVADSWIKMRDISDDVEEWLVK